MLECKQITAVLIANSFNLPIFQQVWLIDNEIVTQAEFDSGNSFFTPAAVSVQAATHDLLILPDRAQVTINSNLNDSSEIIKRVIGGIVNKLPHTPYKAAGLNFTYVITPDEPEHFVAKCKDLFVCNENPLGEYFNSDDARFGTYLSVDVLGSRLRLDIKPVHLDGNKADVLQLNFNANNNLPDVNSITRLLEQSGQINEHALTIATKLQQKLEG